ncbi:MAG: aminotransferase class V-fold PLP-dependent enzyme [Methanobrevibacter sp.]|nr:aminotransferase class V-fold PLP-dependent enzyme [Methanobrevibacter sp.]
MSFYFDNAATTFPKPPEVYDFMDSFYRTCGGNAGRGQYKQAADSTKITSETRELLKELLQCPNKDVVFTPSATLALNMIIQGLIRNSTIKNVWISPFEHNAVTRVLENLKKSENIQVSVLPINEDFEYDFELIKQQFKDNMPELLILSHGSNVCGLINPVEKLCEISKVYNAITVLDMAQTAGLVPLNVGNNNIDFAVFAGHKTLLGPFGISGFVKNKTTNLPTFLFGGTGVESAKQDMPEEMPYKYEMGSQNIQAIAGLHASLKWWLTNTDSIRQKEKENHKRLFDLLSSYDFIKIVGSKDFDKTLGVISCLFDNYTADEIGNVLDEKDVAVRTGLQCSPLAHKTLGTFPAGTVRFSVQYFTSDSDFEGLKNALDYIKENI